MPTITSDSKFEIPVPSSTTELIPDPQAGYAYRVTRSITVEQVRLEALQLEVNAEIEKRNESDRRIAEIQPQIDAIMSAAAKPLATPPDSIVQ